MTPEKANQIAAEFICEGMQYGDPTPKLAQLFVTYCTPAAGQMRDDKGVDRKVLGTLPVTADGCIACPDGDVWLNWCHLPCKARSLGSKELGWAYSTKEAAQAACGQEKKA